MRGITRYINQIFFSLQNSVILSLQLNYSYSKYCHIVYYITVNIVIYNCQNTTVVFILRNSTASKLIFV